MFNLLTLISVGGKIIKESLEPEQPYFPPPKPVIPDDLVVDRARYEHDKALYPTLAETWRKAGRYRYHKG